MTRLELDAVSVRRGGATVLHDVSVHLEQEEVVTILGGNGVGKSTTLRTISGLHRPTDGQIRLDGEAISTLRPSAIVGRGIVHVPEGRQIFAGMTVRENLELGARARGTLTSRDLEQCFDLFPDLSAAVSKRGGLLSGGQQQMLAIARGLMARPRLLLLDEPSLGLSPKIVAQISGIIRQLPSMGIGVLLVEQNATMALDVADRGYLMSMGRIVLSATASELRATDTVRAIYLGSVVPRDGIG
jgi:branched-chain amino acid transport system ATP-binding protein